MSYLLLATSLMVLASAPAVAETETLQEARRAPERRVAQAATTSTYAIPAGPLAPALNRFADESGLQLVYGAEVAQNKRTAGVQGTYTPEQALRLLLAGTGLEYRFTAANTVTLERALVQESGGAVRLAPITVTGEKTVRTLQDTATSVSVLTDENLAERPGIVTLDDAWNRLPNVVDSGSGNFAPTIRGDDATGPANGVFAFLGGTRPRVTIQQDGRALSFNELVYGQTGLWDVERVEVLRGPQTTLQGRNSIAGAIIVDTKDPTFDYEAAGRASIGNYNTRQFSGVISGPIAEDQLAFRLAVDRRDSQSWVDVTGDVGVDSPEEEDSTNVRAKFLLAPDSLPELSAKLTLNHVNTRRAQTEFVEAPFERRENSGLLTYPVFQNEANSGILNLDYSLTENIDLRNTTSYSRTDIDRLTLPNNGIAAIKTHELSNELIAEYDAPGLRGIFGAYYLAAHADEKIDIGGGVFDDRTRTAAIFGEGTITFFERFDLTLGGRYEREARERVGSAGVFNINLDETFDAFMPKVGVAYRPNERFAIGATVQRGWNAGGAGLAFIAPFPSFTYDEEFVWNYEAYFRSNWLDNRLNINGNIFYADYKDQQRLAFLVPGDPLSGVIRNADSTESYGAELSVGWLPLQDLELFGSLGLLQTQIKDFPASAQNLNGNQFARAPDVTASIGALYRHRSGLTFSVDGQYVGNYFSEDDNIPAEEVDAHFLVNAQVAYEMENVRFFAFVTNIFDRDDELLIFDNNAHLVDPRTYGVGLEVKF